MQKLYIIEYINQGISWYWAKDEAGARQEAKECDQVSDTQLDEADIWTIDDAILKDDIINSLNRYILKPITKH